MELAKAKKIIESLLFVANGAVDVPRLTQTLSAETTLVDDALQELSEEYAQRGIRLARNGDAVRLVTAPETADYIKKFLGLSSNGRLSSAALETLAIIAYRQPITRSQLEEIRGVNSDGVVRNLAEKGLVEEIGRLEQPGRPILYGTTVAFLEYFGLSDLEALPPIDKNTE